MLYQSKIQNFVGEKVKAQMVIDTLLQKDRMLDYYKPMNPNGANSQMLNSDQKHPITFGWVF